MTGAVLVFFLCGMGGVWGSDPSQDIEKEGVHDFLLEDDEEESPPMPDPLYYWNVSMFHFNDRLYFWVWKPVATVYKSVTPEIFRTSVRNFFTNLTTPVRFANCLLQGKPEKAGVELSRFMVNTVVGFGGLGNPAEKEPDLKPPPSEDLGQTLGVYGIGNGCFVIWPLIGPSTLRDTLGGLADSQLNPVSYIEPTGASVAVQIFEKQNALSFNIDAYEDFKKMSLDPYTAIRDAYLQHRQSDVNR
jgi:phospholipid-binding lipoprotein MlaA